MPAKSRSRLSPKIRDLVATDRLSRPPVGRLSAAQVVQLAAVARRRQTFDLDVSPARAIRALAEGAKPASALPVLETILADTKASPPERIAAARGVGRIATAAAERTLLRHARTRDPRVQQEVMAALGLFAGPSVGRALGRVAAPLDIATYRQWMFARALMAHRHALDGPFLAETQYVGRTRGRPQQMTSFTARTKTAKATKAARAKLRGADYGIELADRSHSIRCGPVQWELFLNRDLTRSSAALADLFSRPWIAGVLAQWFPREESLQSRFVVLTRPKEGAVRIEVVRADGEVVYTGVATPGDSGAHFQVSDAVRPGTAPLNIAGHITASRIAIERATVFAVRVGVRRAVEAIS